MYRVERKWKSGDIVTIKLNNTVRTETRYNNSASISWGALDFVLRIGESFKQIDIPMDRPVKPSFPTGVSNWEIRPTTDWNYGLVIDREKPQYTIEYNDISKVPFAQKGEPVFMPGATDFISWGQDVPLIIRMKARKVENWGMNGANAGDVPLNPVTSPETETTVELIPYGSSRLRIAEFPVISPTDK